MTTISTSFTAIGTSSAQLLVLPGTTATYTITGTFVATLTLETTTNGGQSWQEVATYTTTQAATTLRIAGTYRWKCTDFTSGTAVAAIATVLAGNAVADGTNFTYGTTTGTCLGTAVTQKIGMWGVTPVVQPSGATQAAPAAYVTGAFGLDSDVKMQALYDLVVAMRTALLAAGIIKGSA